MPKPSALDLSPEDHLAALTQLRKDRYAIIGKDRIALNPDQGYYAEVADAYGAPQDCIAYVQRLFDAGADEILFLTQMGGVPHEVVMETVRLIGTEVIPHFRAAPRP